MTLLNAVFNGLAACVGLLALAACGAPAPTPAPAPANTPPSTATSASALPAFESAYFDVSVFGEGPPVILVPGLASSAAVWEGTVAALEKSYSLHVIQVAGFAGAPVRGNDGNTDILNDLASDLVRYAATLDTAPAIAGHSLGGLVAMKAALEPDARFDRLMIVDVLPFFSVLMDETATAESTAALAQLMKATLLAQPEDVFAARQDNALAALVKQEADRAKALQWSIESDRSVMAQAMSEVLVTDLRDQVADLALPVRVLYARDPLVPNMDAVEAHYLDDYGTAPDIGLTPMDGALHFIMFDQPAAFHAEVRRFLEDMSAP